MTHISWRDEDKEFCVAYSDGKIIFGRTNSDFSVFQVQAHENSLTSLKWSPGGHFIASSSPDGVKIWQCEESVWVCVYPLSCAHEPSCLEWSPIAGQCFSAF